jgi:ketosteroid isomerase-like protein
VDHSNAELIRRLYDARARADRATVRAILDPEVAWHDPYPPPHGGDLHGAEAVFRDVFDKAGDLTGGSTRLWLESVLATDRHAVALVGWSSTYRGRTMRSREIALYAIREGRVIEAWFYPEDPDGALEFFQ